MSFIYVSMHILTCILIRQRNKRPVKGTAQLIIMKTKVFVPILLVYIEQKLPEFLNLPAEIYNHQLLK